MNVYQPLSVARLKHFSRLSDKKYRSLKGEFLIEGIRAVSQVITHGALEIVAIVKDSKITLQAGDFSMLPPDCPIYETDAGTFAKIADTEQSQGLLAVARKPSELGKAEITPQKYPFILALDAISDPGNLGTIYRSAAWFGVSLIILGNETVDLYNPKVVRSTAGAVGSVPVLQGDLADMLPELRQRGYQIAGLELNDTAISLFEYKAEFPQILVIGNEAHGLSDTVKNQCTPVFLPGNSSKVESLNASTAAAIALAHVYQINT